MTTTMQGKISESTYVRRRVVDAFVACEREFELAFPMGEDIAALVCDYLPLAVTLVGPFGQVHGDTLEHCDLSVDLQTKIQRGWKVDRIQCQASIYINGFTFVYTPPNAPGTATADAGAGVVAPSSTRFVDESFAPITLPLHHGEHHQPRFQELVVGPNRFVTNVDFHCGTFGDSLRFTLSDGNTWQAGDSDGGHSQWRLLAPQNETREVVGFVVGVGGHVHNVGVYVQQWRTWEEWCALDGLCVRDSSVKTNEQELRRAVQFVHGREGEEEERERERRAQQQQPWQWPWRRQQQGQQQAQPFAQQEAEEAQRAPGRQIWPRRRIGNRRDNREGPNN